MDFLPKRNKPIDINTSPTGAVEQSTNTLNSGTLMVYCIKFLVYAGL